MPQYVQYKYKYKYITIHQFNPLQSSTEEDNTIQNETDLSISKLSVSFEGSALVYIRAANDKNLQDIILWAKGKRGCCDGVHHDLVQRLQEISTVILSSYPNKKLILK